MPAEFESGFFGGREAAWHGFGNVIEEDVIEAAEAIEYAGLDWNVKLVPVIAKFQRKQVVIPNKYAVQRQTDGSVLGVVGDTYTPVQNAEAFTFMDDLVDSGEAKYHTAGSLKGGKQVWMLARVSKDIQIAGLDDEQIDSYLLLANSFDGSSSLSVSVTPVRVVCMNTLQLALKTAQRQWKARHTKGSIEKLDEARRTLGLTFKYLEEWEALATTLVNTKVSAKRFDKLMDDLIPLPVATEEQPERAAKSKEEARDALKGLFLNSPNLENVRYTAWGAYNAVAEYSDWAVKTRNTKHGDPTENRFARQVSEFGLKDKAQAFILDQWVKA